MDKKINNREFSIPLTLLLVFFLSIAGFAQQNEPIDEKLFREIDVTDDGTDDKIILNIKGESWNLPFKWILTISSKGKKIFEHKSDDKGLDAFFNDNGYVNDVCASYLECKKQYYFVDLIDHLVVETDLSPNLHAYSKNNEGSIYYVAKKELMEKFHLSKPDAAKTIDWMIEKLETKKTPVLYVPISPVQSMFPRMYVDRVGAFVTIYEW